MSASSPFWPTSLTFSLFNPIIPQLQTTNMKKKPMICLAAICFLMLAGSAGQRPSVSAVRGPRDSQAVLPQSAAAVFSWNTFLGSAVDRDGNGTAISDFGVSIGADRQGNLFVAGLSGGSWGAPISPFGGSAFTPDIFIAKLDDQGVLLWNTFLGISTDATVNLVWSYLHSANMAVDLDGNAYVVCTSVDDVVYVAKLNSGGARQWLVSLGSSSIDVGQAIAVDAAGNVYVGGGSNLTWGTPIHAHTANSDVFIAKLDTNGVLQWNTFLGGSPTAGSNNSVGADYCLGIAVDANGNIYATGKSDNTWGAPLQPYFPWGWDTFVAKFDGSGALLWNTFLGASCEDFGCAIAVDSGGSAYVAGVSSGTWGSPVTPYRGQDEAFVVKLNTSGNILWHTYLGSAYSEIGTSLVLDSDRNSYVAGIGNFTWGSPDRQWSGDYDAFAAKLDANGNRSWNTFLGGVARDYGEGIALDRSGYVFVSGRSHASWGAPVRPFPGAQPKAFAAKIDVTGNPPIISASKSDLYFGAVAGGAKSPNQTFQIVKAGPGILEWDLSSNRSWLTCTPSSGEGSGLITVSADPAGLPAGTTDTGAIRIESSLAYNSPLTVNVHLTIAATGSTAAPFGSFDTPLNGTQNITGAIPVTGWALDDIGIQSVRIWRDAVSGETPGQWFVGDAILVEGARPDVETAYPGYPMNSTAGWGYMLLTNMLPNHGNGSYKLYAYATDLEGNVALLGATILACDNAHAAKPFGTIDTPGQGGTSSGTFYNFGWVLTPLNGTVPKDGHTITVYVDSVLRGNLSTPPNVYNQYRADVSGNFPGLNNTGGPGGLGGPVGAFSLNTTGFANGVHSIFWIAYDDLGRGEGIGSRFFNILNAGSSPEPLPAVEAQAEPASDLSMLPRSFDPIRVKTGFDLGAEFSSRLPDMDGILRVEIPEVNRLEIELGGEADAAAFKSGGTRFSGYLIVGNELRPLPIGSTLDRRTGRFSWMPGPGFLGSYDLIFLRRAAPGEQSAFRVRVTIVPKR